MHKFIRIPPTEKRGRTQTSTISVDITLPNEFEFKLDRSKVKRQYIRSSGPGGQNCNKVSSAVELIDTITGIRIKTQDTRDQAKNEILAWERLEDKIRSIHKQEYDNKEYSDRFDQIGYGNGRHKRTYRVKEDLAIDHNTNKKCSFKDILKGKLELLF